MNNYTIFKINIMKQSKSQINIGVPSSIPLVYIIQAQSYLNDKNNYNGKKLKIGTNGKITFKSRSNQLYNYISMDKCHNVRESLS